MRRVLSPIGLDGGDLRLAIVDAGHGAVGNFADRMHLLCYGYDPAQGIYTERITTMLGYAAGATLVLLAGGIFGMLIARTAEGGDMKLAQFTTAASDYAVKVDHLFYLVSVISGLVVLLVTGLIVVFFALYYRGSSMPRGAVPERKSREIEIGWTVATLFTFLFFFWWAASDQLTALTPPKDALEIHVVAKQWMWRIQHPSGAREIDELHVPAHTNVRLVMTSQDVIHDLYLPALRLKQDILPDRYTYVWFNATKTGIFHFTCAEFCGTDHSVMAGRW